MTQLKKIDNSQDIHILDSLRAFAALSVCLYHYVCTTIGLVDTQWVLDLFSFGKYGVQMFFVISGFIIPYAMCRANYSIGNFFGFFLKRLARLEPPYMVSLLLAIVLLLIREKLIGHSEELQELSVKRVLLHFAYLIPFFKGYEWVNQVYWTLAIEFQYYLCIALLFIPLLSGKWFWRLPVCLSLLAAGFHDDKALLLYWLPVFLIGILLFLFREKKIGLIEYLVATFCTTVILSLKHPVGELIYIAAPVLCILFLEKRSSRIGNFLGRMSYSIYLIHPLFGASFINVLSHRVDSVGGKILLVLGGVFITLVSSYIMYLLVEKPSKKLSSGISYKH